MANKIEPEVELYNLGWNIERVARELAVEVWKREKDLSSILSKVKGVTDMAYRIKKLSKQSVFGAREE